MTLNKTHMILAAGLSALLGIATLGAQNLREVAEVPFTFHAHQQALPAGNYEIKETSSTGIFQIYGPNRKALFVGAMVPVSTNPDKPHLKFACYGSECALSEISMPGREQAYRVAQSQLDKNLNHKLGLAAMISVPLKAR